MKKGTQKLLEQRQKLNKFELRLIQLEIELEMTGPEVVKILAERIVRITDKTV